VKAATLTGLREARAAKRPVALLTHLESGEQALVFGDAPAAPPEPFGEAGLEAARAALRSDRSQCFDTAAGRAFAHALNPPLRLAVVGAVHIAQALAPMARLAGYDVTVIDPRRAFAHRDRFPGVEVTTEWPDEALERLAPDARTAIVTLTHDPKLDDPALAAALASPAFYVAALGSRRTHRARLERLRARGIGDDLLARIHGPAGLALGARTPAEIAVSILAEATRCLRGVGA